MASMLISGGNGFLGSHLTELALGKGMDVTVVDDLSTSKKIQVPKDATFVKKRIENYNTKNKYDFVVHLAARPSPEDYMKNSVATIMSNSLGTLKMLEIARRSDAVFLYTSSSEVYGDADVIPTPESYFGYVNPNGIRSCYDESKRFSEALIMAYNREHKLDTRIERPFNVYGSRIRPDGQYGRVIPRFISQALSNKPITIHGNGKQTRSFLYIDDWLDGTWRLLTRKNLGGTVVNIGANDEITVLNLAKLTRKTAGSSSKIVHTGARKEDPKRRAADLRLAKKLLGWEPKTKLDKGLRILTEWFRERT